MVKLQEKKLACNDVSFKQILASVHLTLQPGQIHALIGPSGAGKTTLLWVLAGLTKPTNGKVIHTSGRLSMVFQQPALWDHLTVQQHLKIVGASPKRCSMLLDRLKLTDLCKAKPHRLSGGERRRLSIARALAVEPDWLLLDEPLAHLDGPARDELFELLRNCIKNINVGVLWATHHAIEAMRLANHMTILDNGKIIQAGSPEQIYRQPINMTAAHTTGIASLFNGQIVRPDDVRFTITPKGNESVVRCEYLGDYYYLHIKTKNSQVVCKNTHFVSDGTIGQLSRVST